MKNLTLLFAFILLTISSQAQLIINELSQGASGTKEYVELLVTGTPVCGGTNTVDLRGWIIDDNNSWHASGCVGEQSHWATRIIPRRFVIRAETYV